MQPAVARPDESAEFSTPEHCAILESWNRTDDSAVSIARARVAPGVTTRWHRLHGVVERYVIISGSGFAQVGDAVAQAVGPGDIVVIPPETPQRIRNDGAADLVFYCICTPRFTQACYEALAEDVGN